MLNKSISLREAQDAFLTHLEFRRGCTKSTLVTYRSILSQFLETVTNIHISELTLAHIDMFAEVYSLRGFKPKTYRNKLCVVKSFVAFLYSKQLTDIRPESIEIPKDRAPETVYLTEEERDKLLEAAKSNPRDYAMLHVLVSSGIRVSELTNLKTSDMFRRSISIKNGKGMKHRVTFINQATEQAINDYKHYIRGYEPGFLFPNPLGTSLSRVVIGRKVRYYAEKAKLAKHVKVHTLRHTFATLYLDSGGRIEDLQQMLGHTDLKTTMIYLHFTNERLHSSYDLIMS